MATVLQDPLARVVCVTGMHRSGTSLAARAVNLLGVSFGSPSGLMPPGGDNPRGYWENRAAKELDDEVLASLGGTWDRPPVLADGWEHDAALDPYRARAAAIFRDDLGVTAGGPAVVGWKDPRLSLLLPFWRTVVPVAATVLVVRDPREVVASLHARNAMSTADGAVLWLRYVLAALAATDGPLVVRHRDLVNDLPGTLEVLARGLALPAPTDETLAAVADHVDPSLNHHTVDGAPHAISGDQPTLELAMAVWADGRVDPAALPSAVAESIRVGLLAGPGSRDETMAARAEATDLRERLRKRNRQLRALNDPASSSAAPGAADGPEPGP